jgi:hypothetical protein
MGDKLGKVRVSKVIVGSNPTLDGNGVKDARSIKVYPNAILVHSIIEKKKFENTSSQMGHTKKYIF